MRPAETTGDQKTPPKSTGNLLRPVDTTEVLLSVLETSRDLQRPRKPYKNYRKSADTTRGNHMLLETYRLRLFETGRD